MSVEIPSLDELMSPRFRKKGARPWARHEGFCGECKRMVPLVRRLSPAVDRPGVVGMVLVTHKRHVRIGMTDTVSLTECHGSGCPPELRPDFQAVLP